MEPVFTFSVGSLIRRETYFSFSSVRYCVAKPSIPFGSVQLLFTNERPALNLPTTVLTVASVDLPLLGTWRKLNVRSNGQKRVYIRWDAQIPNPKSGFRWISYRISRNAPTESTVNYGVNSFFQPTISSLNSSRAI